jgi:hypothetical protein
VSDPGGEGGGHAEPDGDGHRGNGPGERQG